MMKPVIPNTGKDRGLLVSVLLTLSLMLAGCSLMQVKKDVETLHKSTVLVGIIASSVSDGDLPVIVAAYTKANGQIKFEHYTILHEPGPYELMVPAGTHSVIAFGDKNRNLTYDEGEPAGQILGAEQISIPAGGVSGNLDIFISEQKKTEMEVPVGMTLPPKKYGNSHSTCPGAIIDLDDEIFSDDFGKKGLWDSLEFFREIGGNVYFLEAYDPDKIPILFVHGAGGSPQNWKTFVDEIDRSKFQPWFYYYPSGSSIDSMSNLLFWKLQNLQAKYKFNRLCITAHSMGGLVVRSFIVNYASMFPSIVNFISISTPWGGEELAELGVKYSPAVIPMWRDMQPGSDFINSIFRKEMPEGVDYFLFFGHKGNRSLIRPNNDNAVTLASQLDPRSQDDAKMIYGFNEDHLSILSSEQVLSQYNAILDEVYSRAAAAEGIPGNRLVVDFDFDFPKEQPKPILALYLSPLGRDGKETWIYLNPDDSGREYGPFLTGDYEVSLIAPAFKPVPVSKVVKIEEGTIPRVHFSFEPQGMIRGYVQGDTQPGLQAGNSHNPDTDIIIDSITLKGNGIQRTLIPLEFQGQTYDDLFCQHYLSETDFCLQGTFFFFGLPEGRYEFALHAEGHNPFTGACEVKLGQYRDTMIIKLVKAADAPSGVD